MAQFGDGFALKANGWAAFLTSVNGEPKAGRSLRSLALRGSAWTIVGYGASQALRLVSNLILTRLLFPEAFGVAALVWLFMQGLTMFSDVGIGPNIVRSLRGDDPAFLNTAWTLQVARGLVLWLCSMLIAQPLAQFYGLPQLVWMIPVAGLTALISGFNATALSTCTRRLLVSRLTFLEITVQAVSLVATVALALLYPSVWALILGSIFGTLARLALSHTVLPGTLNRFQWDREASRELFGFGRWVFLSSLVTFLAMQLDRILLGRLVTMRELGLYTLALMLAQIPRDVFQSLSGTVALPVLSQLLRDTGITGKLGGIILRLVLLSALAYAPLVAWGPTLIGLLYDARYAGASPVLRLLAVGMWLQTISAFFVAVFLAGGKARQVCGGMAISLGIFLTLVYPAFQHFGVLGIAALTALSEVGRLAAYVLTLRSGLGGHGELS